MTASMYDPDAAPERVRVAQARAWLGVVAPEAADLWDHRREIADYVDNGHSFDELGHSLVKDWLAHRDDEIHPGTRRTAERAQSVAWLGEHMLTWERAHALALGREEDTADYLLLLPYWHQHRDESTVPEPLVQGIEALRAKREERVDAAKEWYRRHDPHYLYQWKLSRGFADSSEGEWNDDRHLIQRHHEDLQAAVSTRNPPGKPHKREQPEPTNTKSWERLTTWLTPWRNRPQPGPSQDSISL